MLIDVDVIIKLAAYDLLDAIAHPSCVAGCAGRRGVTATTQYVARRRLKRRAKDPDSALARLSAFLQAEVELEPTIEELQLAARIESEAAAAGLELDSGESQLCAVAVTRGTPCLLTGDKRAIKAAGALTGVVYELSTLTGRVACLEQALVLAVDRLGGQTVRARVRAEPEMDVTTSICFRLTDKTTDPDFAPTGLESYIRAVRASAPKILIEGEKLQLPSVP